MKRRAGLRTWTRRFGGSGLSREAEAWVRHIEDEIQRAVFGAHD